MSNPCLSDGKFKLDPGKRGNNFSDTFKKGISLPPVSQT